MKRGTILILSLTLCSSFLSGCGKTEEKSNPPIAVTVQNVSKEGIENTNEYSGTTKIKNETSVTVEIGGVITGMYADVGQSVHKGDKLLTLKGTDVENNIKQSKAALDLAKASYDSTMENTDISINNQKNQLETNLNVALITYGEAKKSYDIYTQLVESGAVAENDTNYRQIVQGYEKAEQSLKQAQDAYDNGVAEGGKELAKKQLDQAQSSYEIALSARNKLTLYSPVDGIITAKNFNVNETASQTQPAFVISNMNEIEVDLSVTESDISKFQKDGNVTVEIDGDKYSGIIDNVPKVADTKNSLYTVKILVENINGNLKAGQTAEVELQIEKSDNTIAIPKKAVLDEDGNKYVYVVSDDNVAEKTEVKTGIETDNKIQIVSGLTKDKTIVTGGLSLIADQTKIFPVVKED